MIACLEGLLYLLRFAFGACMFSFLNVAACRLPQGESLVKGRSHCPACGRTLTFKEMIPCVSYLILRARCRGCGARIRPRYFLAECIGGAAFALCAYFYGSGSLGLISARGLLIFAFIGILYMVALIDWDTQMIDDRFHWMILFCGILALGLFPEYPLSSRLLGAVVISLPMLVIALVIPGAFGGGDIKLMAASGFLLAVRAAVVGAFIAVFTGGLYALSMLARRRLSGKDHFAFGPFLALGLALAALWGEGIADWYLGLLL